VPDNLREKIDETFVLLYSTAKWGILSVMAGLVVGGAASLFLYLLEKSISFVAELPSWRFLLLPLGLFLSAFLIRALAPEAKGHGTEKVIEAVHFKEGIIPLRVVPVKLVATIITLASGGSAGKEGPCAHIGGGLMSWMAQIFRLDVEDRKKLVVCGISAGFSAVFGTPISGAVFGVEVLYIGQMLYDVLLPSFISGIIARIVASSFGISSLAGTTVSISLDWKYVAMAIFGGVFFGLVSIMHIEMLNYIEDKFGNLRVSWWKKPIYGGFILLAVALIFGTRYLGLGMDTVYNALSGDRIPLLAFAIKSFAMAITLSCGGSGGVLTPTFFVGATAGAALARLFNASPALFSAMGLTAVLAGSANTPITASIMAMELIGPQATPLAALACVVSFVVSGHRSIYSTQILARPKSKAFEISPLPDGKNIFKVKLMSSKVTVIRYINIFKQRCKR